MKSPRLRAVVGLSVAGVALVSLSTPAMAGRCDHSYAVDTPTTLAEVSRRCNVSLSALYEANPGVDPRNVRPGEYLAVPDEINGSAALPTYSATQPAADDEPVSDHPYIVSPDYVASDYRAPITDDDGLNGESRIRNLRGEFSQSAQRIRVRDSRVAQTSTPVWLREEALGARQHSSADRLSYQQLSALRIKNAGLPQAPVTRFASAPAASDVQLIECPVLRKTDGGKIHKVRKIISTPTNTFVEVNANSDGNGFDCRLINASSSDVPLTAGVPAAHYNTPGATKGYRLPDYSKIGYLPSRPRLAVNYDQSSLKGRVVENNEGCLLLRTDNNILYRLSASQPAQDLLGKDVTVWGAAATGGACGVGSSMQISHAVYAEPWPAN